VLLNKACFNSQFVLAIVSVRVQWFQSFVVMVKASSYTHTHAHTLRTTCGCPPGALRFTATSVRMLGLGRMKWSKMVTLNVIFLLL